MPAVSLSDVAIVGSGPIGAVIARELRASSPRSRIVMIEAGPAVGAQPGHHLLAVDDEAAREAYALKVKPGVQAKYVGTTGDAVRVGADDPIPAGVSPAGVFGEDAEQMPGAAMSWNVGGMGVHWTAATPWPFAQEVPAFVPADEWEADLRTAQRLLCVTPDVYPAHPSGIRLMEQVRAVFPATDPRRDVQDMPMAGHHDDTGFFRRTGPADIFPPLGGARDENFTLLADTLCTRFAAEGDRVVLTLRNVRTGDETTFAAKAIVVAADVLRSPQLLYASGVRSAALGRYLNEHVFLTGSAELDDPAAEELAPVAASSVPVPDQAAAALEPFLGSYWLPSSGSAQPFQGQLMETFDPGSGRYSLALSWYVPTEINADNRVEFSETETDRLGMPRMRIHYELSDADRERVARGRASQYRAGRAVGSFDPAETELLPIGGSLHSTGTVRIGPDDDGTSVADVDGRVWGFDNVFVAGNGAIPTALSCNSTLTAAALAVRTARAVARRLS